MKGVSLPINTLIIIVIGSIVLLGVVALFAGGFNPFSTSVNVNSAKNEACMELVRKGCTIGVQNIFTPNFDSDKDGVVGDVGVWFVICGQVPAPGAAGDNLAQLCRCYYGITSNLQANCRKLCGCPS